MKVVSIRRIPGHEYCNARILEMDNGYIYLQSYFTIVCGLTYPDCTPFCKGNYGKTTNRQITWFGREYGLSWADFKATIGDGLSDIVAAENLIIRTGV